MAENPVLAFAERVAGYVETANSYDAWDKHRVAVEAVRVACEEARDDLMLAIERKTGNDPPARGKAEFGVAQQAMEAALKPFGWTCGPEFWQRYYQDPWVFNLANAVERLSAERDRLSASLQRIHTAAEQFDATP